LSLGARETVLGLGDLEDRIDWPADGFTDELTTPIVGPPGVLS